MIKIIRYEHNDIISENISKLSNARLIWGSDKTINELKKKYQQQKGLEILLSLIDFLCAY